MPEAPSPGVSPVVPPGVPASPASPVPLAAEADQVFAKAGRLGAEADLLFALPADIDPEGRFRPGWLLAGRDRVRVVRLRAPAAEERPEGAERPGPGAPDRISLLQEEQPPKPPPEVFGLPAETERRLLPGSFFAAETLNGSGILLVQDLPPADFAAAVANKRGEAPPDPVLLARYSLPYHGSYSLAARRLNAASAALLAQTEEAGRDRKEGAEPDRKEGARPVRPEEVDADFLPSPEPALARNRPPAVPRKSRLLRRLFQVAWPYRLHFLLALLCFWGVAGTRVVNPYVVRRLIDDYLAPRNVDIGIALLVAAILFFNGVAAALHIARGRILTASGNAITRDLRRQVFEKLQKLSLSFIGKTRSGDLMGRVMRDTGRIQEFIQNRMAMSLNELFTLVAIGAFLFISEWKLALLILLPTPVVLFACYSFRLSLRRMYREGDRLWEKANTLLHELFGGIRVVKAFGQEEREVRRFAQVSEEHARVAARNEKTWNTVFTLLAFFMGMGNFLVLYYGGNMVLGREMQLGELVQYSQYAGMIYGPLNWLAFFPRWFTTAMEATARYYEVMDEPEEMADRPAPVTARIRGAVEFRGVTFGYDPNLPIVDGIDLKVRPGEMVGLVGPSGAGKSTLINLLMRLYDVDGGALLIDGIDLRDYSRDALRSQMGVVLQETYLFTGSVLDNIRFSKPDASLSEVIRAARIANAHDFILRFPDGYDTRVGEKGQKLSGGEKQRIAIARALLHNPRLLILDEATASMDTETEQVIQEALSRLVKGRTTFAIAHRLSTLRHADRIVVLDKGRMVESGTHAELIHARGMYFDLVMAQRHLSRLKPGAAG